MNERTKLRVLQIEESGFAFDPTTGSSYTLNPAAVRVIGWLIGGSSEGELPALLAAEYSIPAQSAERDIENILATLRGYQLL